MRHNIQGSRTITRRPNDGNDGNNGNDGITTQAVYIRNNVETDYPTMPSGNNLNGWTFGRQAPTLAYRFEWTTQRSGNDKVGWSAWSTPIIINRWVVGEPGASAKWLKLNASATQIRHDSSNTPMPSSISVTAQLFNLSGTATWTYAINGGTFTSTQPTGVTRSGNVVTINSSTSTFQSLTINALIDGVGDSVTITRTKDGAMGSPGMPGQVVITKEWIIGDTHHYTDQIIDFIYVRGSNAVTSYWYKLATNGTRTAGTPPSGGTTPIGYERISWMDSFAVKLLIAEGGNLAGFIFAQNVLTSQDGTDTAGNTIVYGEYTQFEFGRSSSLSTSPTTWTALPSTSGGTYEWIRYRNIRNSGNTSWVVRRISGSDAPLSVRYSNSKNGDWYASYASGRIWIELTSEEFGEDIYKINVQNSNEFDFEPYTYLNGTTGEIRARRINIFGNINAETGNIARWILESGMLRSRNKRLNLNAEDNSITILDAFNSLKLSLSPKKIESPDIYFNSGINHTIDTSPLAIQYGFGIGNSAPSQANTSYLPLDTSGGKIYEMNIPSCRININLNVTSIGGGIEQPMGVVADLILYLRVSGLEKIEIGRASTMSTGGLEADTEIIPASTRTITQSGTYSLQAVLSIGNPSGQNYDVSGSISQFSNVTINQVLNRSEIGMNGIMLASSSTRYAYIVPEDKIEFRINNYGFRITSSGFQKTTNGTSWTNSLI